VLSVNTSQKFVLYLDCEEDFNADCPVVLEVTMARLMSGVGLEGDRVQSVVGSCKADAGPGGKFAP